MPNNRQERLFLFMHMDNAPHFDDAGRLIAPAYGDVYFSAEDGLAETRHVFLEGNHLTARFAGMKPGETFTIGETGFGTGLNFLAAWQLFVQHAPPDARLAFVSVEGLPLDAQLMGRALSPWQGLATYRAALLKQWGPMWDGKHRLRFDAGRVRLALLVGEAADVLSAIDTRVNAWFLDGFAPSRNPAMWSEEVFAHIGRCSVVGTTLATYTAAGFVRRGLAAVGFKIEKQTGFGTKRDMTVGHYGVSHSVAPLAVACKAARRSAAATRRSTKAPRRSSEATRRSPVATRRSTVATVIGGSIAGAFAARSLAERGVRVTVLEKQGLVDGQWPSLGKRVGVLQPKINDIHDAAGQWLREGYGDAYRLLSSDSVIAKRSGWQACGTFQAAHDERSTRRLRRFVDQFGSTGLCRWLKPEQTASAIGVALRVGGVLIERAGVLRPAGLCAALLDHPLIRVQDNCPAISLQRDGQHWTININTNNTDPLTCQHVIIANALNAKNFEQTSQLKLKPVRGQVTLIREDGQARKLSNLRCPLFYGGYALPMVDGLQALGASFVPGETGLDWRDDEHIGNCNKLARVLPDEAERLHRIQSPAGWVGLRTTTPRHRCYAEQLEDGLYVSLGHGSHGIASASRAAEHIACDLTSTLRRLPAAV